MEDVVIAGFRMPTGRAAAVVWIDKAGDALRARHDLRNHSPDGFNWGYGGSGPAQLALAILAEVLGDDDAALASYQRFKFEVVARLPWHGWSMTASQVWDWWLQGVAFETAETVDLLTEEVR